jgi:hypothetical protein
MTDPVTEVKTVVADVKADVVVAQSFLAKQIAWVKANPVKTGTAVAAVLAVLAKLFL